MHASILICNMDPCCREVYRLCSGALFVWLCTCVCAHGVYRLCLSPRVSVIERGKGGDQNEEGEGKGLLVAAASCERYRSRCCVCRLCVCCFLLFAS